VSILPQTPPPVKAIFPSHPCQNQQVPEEFISRLIVLPWTSDAAVEYGKIRKRLEKKGTVIGNMDLMIAAHALSENHTLAANNPREFRRVEGLACENWLL